MKETLSMRFVFLLMFFFCCASSHAQLKQISIVRQQENTSEKMNQSTRVQSLSAMQLPFWDDFSFSDSKNYPHDSLWQSGHSVWVNTGMGINPPTLKVATFDGLNASGLPYNINLASAKGVADSLVSRPIRMDLVNAALQDSVFIFFYYQYQGNGEAPDPGDELSLWFKKNTNEWIQVWSKQVDSTSDRTKFIPVKLYVKDTCKSCFYSGFQFRFQNFARLSGPFDTWNIDYVYMNNGKSQYSPRYADIPDRAIATPLSSFLTPYNSVPVKHLLSKGDALLSKPSIVLTNQRKDQSSPNFQPTSLIVRLNTATRLNKTVTQTSAQLDSVPGILVQYDIPTVVKLNTLPTFTSFDSHVDSIAMKFLFKLNSGDHVNKIDVNTGDYDTLVYKPLEFRYNDSTSTNFIFTNYYAYDDGVAEYAATLTQGGNQLAYEFDMTYDRPDTLVAVDIYFPHVGDETDQVLSLSILGDQTLDVNTTKPISLTSVPQDVTVSRTANNTFTRVKLNEAITVTKKFFISYKQNSSATIGVGLDKNSDSGNKVFANLGTGWAQSDIHGNLMIRPVFGSSSVAKGPVTVVEEQKLYPYPNPNHGVFYIPQQVQGLQVFDMTGRSISFAQEDSFQYTQIILSNHGVYLVRYFDGKQWRTEKIMVLP